MLQSERVTITSYVFWKRRLNFCVLGMRASSILEARTKNKNERKPVAQTSKAFQPVLQQQL